VSGIVGIVNLDGAPINRRLLDRMTDFMSYRGPDASATWVDGHVGFGHTMLRTTWEAETERQPLSLDGRVWLTADARIDGRADLIAALESRGRPDVKHANDAELILHAYHAWGEDCVDHLIGDFAFGIWDGREQRLFCARDHFGVKPFYYACRERCFVFGNTLNCLRLHPAVTDTLNEIAIGDFLLFGENQDDASTSFRDVSRLRAAHRLLMSADHAPCPVRYWSVPTDFHLHYSERSTDDVVEGFRESLSRAVRDRLRAKRIALEMSGGLDSTSIAATTRDLSPRGGGDLRAFCISYADLIPDREKEYADCAATALGMPITHVIADRFPLFEIPDAKLPRPDPGHVGPLTAPWNRMAQSMAAHSRVVLTGWDGDTLLTEDPRHYFYLLLRTARLQSLLAALFSYMGTQRRPPPVGLRTVLKRLLGKSRSRPPYPCWLEPEFERRTALSDRWRERAARRPPPHPTRPYALRILALSTWAHLFESYDSGVTGLPLEGRHPLVDIRVVDYLLRLPPVPWCAGKHVQRVAMRGRLPERVRRRPKTPLAGDPAIELARRGEIGMVEAFWPSPHLRRFVNFERIPRVSGQNGSGQIWMNVRPFALNLWYSCSIPFAWRSRGAHDRPAEEEGLQDAQPDRVRHHP
jgi:asparagine synthase (glutamine-hydrolysing)